MTKKNKKVNKIERSEILYYRMIVVLAVLIAVIFSITYFTGTNEDYNFFASKTAPVAMIVFAVLSIPSIAIFVLRRARGVDEKYTVFSSGYLLTLLLWLTSIFAFYNILSSKKLFAYIIVSAALYFVYNLFKREFFVFSLYTAVGAGLLALINSASRIQHVIFSILLVVISAAMIMLVLRKKAFKIKIGKNQILISDGSYKAYPFCISAGIMLAGVILSFLFVGMAFYSLVVLFVYYLILTIVNTVKMM